MTFPLWFGGSSRDDGEPHDRATVGSCRDLRLVSSGNDTEAVPSEKPAEDRELFSRLRAGDMAALEELVRTFAVSLEAHAYTVVRADDLARDVVQDVFIRFWEQREITDIRGSVRAYLHRAVHFAAVSALRHELTERRVASVEHAQVETHAVNAGEQSIEDEELDGIVRAAVAALPARCREIFLLHREAGLSYAEIAESLELAPQTVANQMHRALKALAQAVRRWRSGE